MKRASRPSFPWFIAALTLAFLFRLAYGLCNQAIFIDQRQVFMIGLKFYGTGLWPYFGADVAKGVQLPGALQGLVVAGPLHLLPIPEAPYFLLNILSFAGLCLFAWYCSKRLPGFPPWILWTWTLTAPWVLNWSAHVDNDSYMLFGSCLFFVGFLETIPALTLGRIPPVWANAMMGFALLWGAQFHLSYVLYFPFLAVSAFFQFQDLRKGKGPGLLPRLGSLGLGAAVPGAFLLPTFLHYGWGGSGGLERTVRFNPGNFLAFFDVLARYLSLASCEVLRFLGPHTAQRMDLLRSDPWLVPFAAITIPLGILQTLALLVLGFRTRHPQGDWNGVRALALATFLLIYCSFLFSIKSPAAHTYFSTLPVAMLYGFYAFLPWAKKGWFLRLAGVLLAANLILHAGLAVHNYGVKSLYVERGLYLKAIQERDYRILGERRSGSFY